MTGIDGSSDDEMGLHARLVAGVKARGGDIGQVAVWAEHSYSQTGQTKDISCILAPKTSFNSMVLDVDSVSPPPPVLPGDEPFRSEAAYPAPDQDTFDEWENRVVAISPSAACTRVVRAVSRALNDLRLRRLTVNTAGRIARREQARHTARRLRHLLAPMWVGKEGSGSSATSGAVWVVNALGAYLPTTYRGLWEEAITELRTLAPRLTSRLPPGPVSQPLYPATGLAGPDHRPVLAWVPSGSPAQDARWIRRLKPLLEVRVLVDKLPHASSPETWTTTLAASARRALNEALTYAGQRGLILAGTTSGAQLVINQANSLGSSPTLRGVVLIAPSLSTAEGPISLPDSKSIFSPPCMVVSGNPHGARRVRLVKGADGNLVLPANKRMRYKLPQAAIDAAVAQEISVWAQELSLCEESTESEEEYAHLPPASPLTDVTLTPVKDTSGGATAVNVTSVSNVTLTPTATPPASAPAPAPLALPRPTVTLGPRVSRVSGRTPLTLTPPSRPSPVPAGRDTPLGSADIMTLPVVFADDPPTSTPTPTSSHTDGAASSTVPTTIPTIVLDDGPITVTSGGGSNRSSKVNPPIGGNPMKYTRVIVAKRGSTTGSPLVVRSVKLADKVHTID